ncbi:MAG TPA: response regulator [Xanthobacteraceae bacterium]|nr:response regulator [Xanthobacteraceae bacterium]
MFEQSGPPDPGRQDIWDQQDLVAADARLLAPRLLVIDDDNLHRMIICRAAAKVGYLPAGAATYDEAAKLAQETAFDCITLDLSLGAHAGSEMLHHLSELGCTAPIIVVSGCDDATCKEAVKLAGRLNLDVWECIPKPVDLVMLRHFLERLKAARGPAAMAA